jgi:hypothetical protein
MGIEHQFSSAVPQPSPTAACRLFDDLETEQFTIEV